MDQELPSPSPLALTAPELRHSLGPTAQALRQCPVLPPPEQRAGWGGDGTPPVSLTPVSMLVSLSLPTLSPCHGVLPAGEGTRPCPSVAAHSSN